MDVGACLILKPYRHAGKPKGVLHTTGGYMVMAGTTTRYSFDLQPGDVWWCTADPGDASMLH